MLRRKVAPAFFERENERERERKRSGMILLNDATVHIGTSSSYHIPLPEHQAILSHVRFFPSVCASACLCLSFRWPVLDLLFPVWARSWLKFNYQYSACATSTKLSARLGVTRVHRRKSAFALSRHVTKSRVTSDDISEEVLAAEPESRIFKKFRVEIK